MTLFVVVVHLLLYYFVVVVQKFSNEVCLAFFIKSIFKGGGPFPLLLVNAQDPWRYVQSIGKVYL